MNWEGILNAAWSALNSPVGIVTVAGLVLWLLNRLYAAKPGWKKYEGAIISAVLLVLLGAAMSAPAAGTPLARHPLASADDSG